MSGPQKDSIVGLSETALEARARAGDPKAVWRLLEQARDELVRFCFRYLGNVDEAEDAVADVIAAMIGQPWPEGSSRAYLRRACRNRCFDRCRDRQDGRVGLGPFLGDSRVPSPRTGPGTAVMRKDEQEALRRHLAGLSRGQAEVLTLRYFDGLARKEIAEVLDLSESVVKSRLHDALESLDRLIKEDPP